ncbi:MAG: carbohydrate ABC transporter permease [Roseburia sp.]|uniref:carbohydrate ABC transporter permease n=1 Tax=Roseburia hominis TaxID=301301 RepID=UPI001F48DE91|nr:sugar ABC transporter permease [Roseburia hominis]MCI5712704.1 sugar ABC transporter permease [Lachnospiraceae bacterium]MDY4840704.1 sugar ABC transporter permease [Lachnospiraceae bacterium]MEE1249880.1 sugar ABC transporter permease [Lachnospiraceae bacterium]
MKEKIKKFFECCRDSSWQVRLSAVVMGGGQMCYGRPVKGIMLFLAQVSILIYFITRGWRDIQGFFTLGTTKGDAWLGIEGDNSVVMLLMGIFAWIILAVFIALYRVNLKDVYQMQKRKEQGKRLLTFKEEAAQFLDKKFYMTVLVLPVIGVCIFNILPILFMILIAFTNYGGAVVPPELVDWVGFENFKKLVTLSQFAPTFFKILGWNLVWAVISTALNYFAGLGLALLLEKECVKGKAFWRAFPVLAYAIPGFITLMAFKFMFSYGGPVNQMIVANGGTAIGFLDLDAKWSARLIGLLVNCWISVPSIMLLATGNLANRDMSLYEAARIDGASRWKQFEKLTMPFMLFSTMPVLLGQFTGNFNNFGIFYFLRGGLYLDDYFLASDTDLLINWLYNLSIDNNYYCIGAAISLVIFLITSVISLAVYIKSPSYREEDTFQ